MHLLTLPDHQNLFFKKYIFYRLEWLKTCFDAYAHTSITPKTFSKEILFTVWSGKKRVLMHLRILPYHQKLVPFKVVKNVWFFTSRPPETFFKKNVFFRLEWLKTCFDAFAHTSRPLESCS
jgi:hypothetical protein